MITKLWLVSRTDRIGYDEYDSFVCAADTYDEALHMHPNEGVVWCDIRCRFVYETNKDIWYPNQTWAGLCDVVVEYIGQTEREIRGKIICASFNAG